MQQRVSTQPHDTRLLSHLCYTLFAQLNILRLKPVSNGKNKRLDARSPLTNWDQSIHPALPTFSTNHATCTNWHRYARLPRARMSAATMSMERWSDVLTLRDVMGDGGESAVSVRSRRKLWRTAFARPLYFFMANGANNCPIN